jgi:hypothetical protein
LEINNLKMTIFKVGCLGLLWSFCKLTVDISALLPMEIGAKFFVPEAVRKADYKKPLLSNQG